jgi:hypothetical protein
MSADPHAILARAAALGVTVNLRGPDSIGIGGPKEKRPEILAAVKAAKPELLDLLRAGRVAEVRAFYSQAFTRLGALYGDNLIGNLWPAIVAERPDLARGIDTAEAASDRAALDYQSGTAPDSSAFLAALATWERTWAEAIEAVTARGDRCSDCGKAGVVLVGVDYSPAKFCRACLRPTPLNCPPRVKGPAHA